MGLRLEPDVFFSPTESKDRLSDRAGAGARPRKEIHFHIHLSFCKTLKPKKKGK